MSRSSKCQLHSSFFLFSLLPSVSCLWVFVVVCFCLELQLLSARDVVQYELLCRHQKQNSKQEAKVTQLYFWEEKKNSSSHHNTKDLLASLLENRVKREGRLFLFLLYTLTLNGIVWKPLWLMSVTWESYGNPCDWCQFRESQSTRAKQMPWNLLVFGVRRHLQLQKESWLCFIVNMRVRTCMFSKHTT